MAITGEMPVFRFLHISMFDGIVIDVIKARPEVTLASNADIPITIPNCPSAFLVEGIHFIRSSPVTMLHKRTKIVSKCRKKKEMVVIRKHNPGSQFNLEFCDQFLEYIYP